MATLLASCAVDTVCRQEMGVTLGIAFSGDSIKVTTDTIKIPTDTVKVPVDTVRIPVDTIPSDSNLNFVDSVVYSDSIIYRDSIAYTYDSISFTSVKGMSVHGVLRDSLLADGTTTLSALRVPLRKDADTTAFVFTYRGAEDTLYISYDRQEMFVSLACGCAVFATIDSVWCPTAQFIDSLDILNTAVTTGKDNHIKLYFHNPE